MGVEIERKFLVRGEGWRHVGEGLHIVQGYLPTSSAEVAVRVRLVDEGAWLTMKGPSHGARRAEFEYEIPWADAREILAELCIQPPIDKTRHRIEHAGRTWEIDEFQGENRGLVLAEVELDDETASLDLPGWVGDEVTGDPRYSNAYLASRPFTTWADS